MDIIAVKYRTLLLEALHLHFDEHLPHPDLKSGDDLVSPKAPSVISLFASENRGLAGRYLLTSLPGNSNLCFIALDPQPSGLKYRPSLNLLHVNGHAAPIFLMNLKSPWQKSRFSPVPM